MQFRNVLVCTFLTLGVLTADTLKLKDGTTVNGTFLGGNSRQVRMALADHIQTFDIENVSSIQFGQASSTPASPQHQPAPAASYPEPAPQSNETFAVRPDAGTSSAPDTGVEVPAGTEIAIRTIDPIDSQVSQTGETFRASVDEPVTAGGAQIIPRGADVVVKLVDAQESGKIAGKTVLTLDLVSVTVNGRIVNVNTQSVTKASSSRTARSGKVIGGATVLGAILGAAAGGGTGAAIGAASGAAVGTGAQVATKGQRVHIPPETRLTFTLEYPVRI